MSLKLSNGQITKKIKMASSFEELVERTKSCFPSTDSAKTSFFYVDEDQDKITIENDFDLQECKDYLDSIGGSSIKLFLQNKEQEVLVSQSFIRDNLDNNISYMCDRHSGLEIENSINQSIAVDERLKKSRIEAEQRKLDEINSKYAEVKKKTKKLMEDITKGDIFTTFKAEVGEIMAEVEKGKEKEQNKDSQEGLNSLTLEMEQKLKKEATELEIKKQTNGFLNAQEKKLETFLRSFDPEQTNNTAFKTASNQNNLWSNSNQSNTSLFQRKDNAPLFGTYCNNNLNFSTNSNLIKEQTKVSDSNMFGCVTKGNNNKFDLKPLSFQVTHRGITCDGCGIVPITGIRHKCTICPDFDYCGTCLIKNFNHDHPFTAYTKPAEMFSSSSQFETEAFHMDTKIGQLKCIVRIKPEDENFAKQCLREAKGDLVKATELFVNRKNL